MYSFILLFTFSYQSTIWTGVNLLNIIYVQERKQQQQLHDEGIP